RSRIGDELLTVHEKEDFDDGDQERFDRLRRGWDKTTAEIVKLEERQERVEKIRQGIKDGTVRMYDGLPNPQSNPFNMSVRDAALNTIERYNGTGRLSGPAADRLDSLVRDHDPTGSEARYLTAVGDSSYYTAFGKLLASPQDAHLRMTPEEAEAMRN